MAGNGNWMLPFPDIDPREKSETASGLTSGERLLDEFPDLFVAERLHALLHAGRPAGAVLIHLAEAGGDLWIATGKSLNQFPPPRRQSLRFFASRIFRERPFHIAEEFAPLSLDSFLEFR